MRSEAGCARQRRARSDFPEPDSPRISAARPLSAIAVPWTSLDSPTATMSKAPRLRSAASPGRKTHDEAGAQRRIIRPGSLWHAVLRPDLTAMSQHDLARDRQAETRIVATAGFRRRAVGVKAPENLLQVFGRDAGTVILHADFDPISESAGAHQHHAALGRERNRVVHEVGNNLRQAAIVPVHNQRVIRARRIRLEGDALATVAKNVRKR